MKYNQETTEEDLLMLPEIDGMVMDIKNQETVSKTAPKVNYGRSQVTQEDDRKSTSQTASWVSFLKCSEQYEYRVKQTDRKVCLVDAEIVETLKMCDINKMSTATMINSILRAFITENKDALRQHTSRNRTLI